VVHPPLTALDVRPLGPAIGAEVHGVDLARPLPDETVAAIRAAWLEHLVLFFPDQELTAETQLAFASRFGTTTEAHPVEKPMPGNDRIHAIDSIKDRTDYWHTDVTFMASPPSASLLYAVQLPPVGGDTMWSSTRAAYETLAPPLQRMCDDLTAYHYDEYYARIVEDGGGQSWNGKPVTKLFPVEHPVVRVHPETGTPNLFVNPQFTVGLKEFPAAQGHALLRVLYDHMTRPEFVVRYRWREGTLGFWDNRATMHYGIFDYGTERRIMHRVTLRGDRPAGR
jgi:taurine dioxygenase